MLEQSQNSLGALNQKARFIANLEIGDGSAPYGEICNLILVFKNNKFELESGGKVKKVKLRKNVWKWEEICLLYTHMVSRIGMYKPNYEIEWLF